MLIFACLFFLYTLLISLSTFSLFGMVSETITHHLFISVFLHFFSGFLLAVVVGLLYGSSAVPVLYIKSHSSCNDSVFHGASIYGMLSVSDNRFYSYLCYKYAFLQKKWNKHSNVLWGLSLFPHCFKWHWILQGTRLKIAIHGFPHLFENSILCHSFVTQGHQHY